jgi:hypothetical protein
VREQTTIIRKGTFQINSLVTVILALARLQDVRLTWGDVKKERSDQQNKALWGCAYEHLRTATGNDKDDLHEYFCGEYFGWEVREVMGMKKKYPKRTTTTGYDGKRDVITTLQLSDFYAFIQQRSAETVNVYIPDPNPEWWSHREQAAA